MYTKLAENHKSPYTTVFSSQISIADIPNFTIITFAYVRFSVHVIHSTFCLHCDLGWYAKREIAWKNKMTIAKNVSYSKYTPFDANGAVKHVYADFARNLCSTWLDFFHILDWLIEWSLTPILWFTMGCITICLHAVLIACAYQFTRIQCIDRDYWLSAKIETSSLAISNAL